MRLRRSRRQWRLPSLCHSLLLSFHLLFHKPSLITNSVSSSGSSINCASSAASSSSSSSSAVKTKKKKHRKEGEYPGVSETSIPSRFNNNNKAPIKNIRKKLERKYEARSWANTVTEALSNCIDKKQCLQALKFGRRKFNESHLEYKFLGITLLNPGNQGDQGQV